jgi:polyisoprenoid-binding protein YceI
MKNRYSLFFKTLLTITLSAACAGAAAGALSEWRTTAAESELNFIFGQAGTYEKGKFKTFDAHFYFEPGKIEQGRFEATVDMNSVDTGDKERDGILRSADMFDVKRWPQAKFKTLSIARQGENEYLAQAELTIRDKTRRIAFPFRLEMLPQAKQPAFRLRSELNLKRLEFGIGQGEYAPTTWIADDVKVMVDVQASKIQ